MVLRHHLFLASIIFTALAFERNSAIGDNHISRRTIIGWSVQKASTIQIKGSTNINQFGCDIANYTQPDTIFCTTQTDKTQLVKLNGEIQIGISKFDCHNKALTRDLRKTLKAGEYPLLVIRFLSLERTPAINKDKDSLSGWVEIELAGCARKFEVNYAFVKSGPGFIQLNGNRSFRFSDFKLQPPKKFAGLIKVKDTLVVDFNLLLDPIQ